MSAFEHGHGHGHGHGRIRLREEQSCTQPGCVRPMREVGGLCSRCWWAASAATRVALAWEAGCVASPSFDVVAAAEAILRAA